MFYFYALLLIVSGLFIAWFGQKKYGLTFASTYLATSFLFYFMLNSSTGEYPYFSIFLGITLAITLVIWLFSKAFTYFFLWEMICMVFMLFWLKINGGDPSAKPGVIFSLMFLILPIFLVYYFRKIIPKITIGFFSGLNIAFGLISIILIEKFKSGAIFFEQPTWALITLLICLAGGIYFQFSPYANNKPITKDS